MGGVKLLAIPAATMMNKTNATVVLLLASTLGLCQSERPSAPIPKLSSLIALSALERHALVTPNSGNQKIKTEGMAIFRIAVDEQGQIIRSESITVLPEIQPLAENEIKQWHFKQVQSHGVTTPWWSFVGVCFSHLWKEPAACAPPQAEQGEYTSATLPTRIFSAGSASTDKARNSLKPLELIRYEPLEYPSIAKAARVQGPVDLEIVVGRDGSITQVTPIKGHPMLVDAAVQGVKSWKFRPLVFVGKPIEAQVNVVVNYAFP
jgi:TonB family protein